MRDPTVKLIYDDREIANLAKAPSVDVALWVGRILSWT